MQQALKEKLDKVIAHVYDMMADPDIDIEHFIPDSESEEDPYLLVSYSEDKYVKRKIRLNEKYLQKSVEEIANLITFSIEQFKEEIDSVQLGG